MMISAILQAVLPADAIRAAAVMSEDFGYWSEAEGKFELADYIDEDLMDRIIEGAWRYCNGDLEQLAHSLVQQALDYAPEERSFIETGREAWRI